MKWIFHKKIYALVCGFLLFAFGVVGFAFRGSFDIGGQYLILSLLLGFWGLLVAFVG